MKKVLLTLAVLSVFSQQGSAQPFTQNFNSGIPATWPMIKVDNGIPNSTFVASIVSKLTTQAWMSWLRTPGDSCALTVSYFNPVGQADRWLISPSFQVTSPNMVISWEDYAGDPTYADSIQVLVSPTAGTTASSFTSTIYNDKGSTEGFIKKGASLGSFNGQTIRVAFRNNSTDQYVLMLDNVEAIVLPSLDASVDSVIFPRLANASGNTVKVIVSNQSAATITSVVLNYSIDGGSPVSQTFNGLNLLPYGKTTLQFTTTAGGAQGGHTLAVNLTQANSTPDPVAGNNSKSTSFSVPFSSVPRNGLVEEFTSSTCVPCAGFNVWYDPMILSNNANEPSSHFNIIKYQMNWPSPGNDVSYNNDGLLRRTFYGVNSIPDHFVNGEQGIPTNQSQTAFQTEINDSKTAPAYLSMSGSYAIKGDSLIATVTITPTFTLSNANFKLYMAATEEHYTNNGATTTQKQYYHVMRKMLPDGNGITINNFTNGVPQTFTQRYKYTVGTVTQMSNIFWGSPFAGNLVVFLQDPSSSQIIQSASFPAQWPTSVNDLNGGLGNIKVYPNPAKEGANVAFTLDKAASVNISVVDAVGHVVYNTSDNMNAGAQHLFIPTTNFAAGHYNVLISSEEGKLTSSLTVVK